MKFLEFARSPKGFTILVVLAALAILLFMSRGGDEEAITYTTAAIDRGDVTRRVSASGTLSALVTVEVGSQLSGQITAIYADYNSAVKKGDLIALIDPKTFKARVEQAQADVEVAHANLEVQKANLVAERASVTEAQRDFDRKQELSGQGIVSTADLDRSRAALETAQARVLMAEAQVSNANANVRQRESALNQAQIDLERTEIRAPVNGVVIERNVDVGQTVAASFSAPVLFRIAQDLEEMQVEAQVDEADIGEVVEGNIASFTVDAYPDDRFRGRVRQVRKSPVTLDNVVTYTVVISARNEDQRLLPGMTADVEIITGERQDVLRVPNAALNFRPRGAEETPAASGGFSAGGGNGGGGAPGGGGNFLARLTEQLDLTEAQQQQIRDEFSRVRQNILASANGDPQAARQAMRNQISGLMERVLTPEQLARFQELQPPGGNVRVGEVWLMGADGEPVAKRVRLGISDDNYTEILAGEPDEGAVIITGARRQQAGG